jgi:hypothetical protein
MNNKKNLFLIHETQFFFIKSAKIDKCCISLNITEGLGRTESFHVYVNDTQQFTTCKVSNDEYTICKISNLASSKCQRSNLTIL